MRLWSIHPEYLDQIGLVALWRETLLAQNVLLGKTKGYRNHPQLIRFKNHNNPISAIGYYLHDIYLEAKNRNYNFDYSKIIEINKDVNKNKINVTIGQVEYEFAHLKRKLQNRDVNKFDKIKYIECNNIKTFELFNIVDGNIEQWEIVN